MSAKAPVDPQLLLARTWKENDFKNEVHCLLRGVGDYAKVIPPERRYVSYMTVQTGLRSQGRVLVSAGGFPDIVAYRWEPWNGSRLRFLTIELKSQVEGKAGRPRPDQQDWLRAYHELGAEDFVFKPIDWITGRIQRIVY